MATVLNLIETTTELGIEVVEVVIESASAPGPAGPGVPVGGTDGQVLTKTSATDYATAWEDPTGGGGGGAPTDADYLVGTANGSLSAEIVVGTTPGGELGNTWASPTVDAMHSGSTHASVQAAAEATAAAALGVHAADTTAVHGITDTSTLYVQGGTDVAIADGGTGASTAAGARANLDLEAGTDFPSLATFNDHSTRHENGGADELSLAGLSGEPADTVNKSLYDANTVLAADSDNTPAALTMGASTILARLAAGNIKAATPSELRTLLDVPTNAEAILDALLDAKGDIISATAADTSARLAVGSDGQVLTADSGESTGLIWATPSAGGAVDPIFDLFGTPDTAFEFDTSSLSGLTALSPTPDVVDADTTVPGCYFLRDDAASFAACGHYVNGLTPPFTAITCLIDTNISVDFGQIGLFVGESTPGVMENEAIGRNSGNVPVTSRFTNPTTFGSAIATGVGSALVAQPPWWIAIRVTLSTNVTYLFSPNGRVWRAQTSARNPAITVASAGLYLIANNAGVLGGAFDYLRIWNSALTFPGVP